MDDEGDRTATFAMQGSVTEGPGDKWVNIDVSLTSAWGGSQPLRYNLCFYSTAWRSTSLGQTGANGYDYRVVRDDGSIGKGLCAPGTIARGATQSRTRIRVLDDSHEDSGERIEVRIQMLEPRNWDAARAVLDGPMERTLIIYNDEPPGQDGTPAVKGVSPALVAAIRGFIAEPGRSAEHVERWKRVLKAFGETDADLAGLEPMTSAEARDYAERKWPRWDEVAFVLAQLEAAAGTQDTTGTPPPVPEVTITADAASATEGGDASFTITADPPPAAPLAVDVSVAASGDYGVNPKTRTVTICGRA
ncbi:MAG: hypothetical protein F4X42_09010 [Rhodospirillaceae bacterium]|nr:hypothetical protein [Rhodospirillaceae bacterium]